MNDNFGKPDSIKLTPKQYEGLLTVAKINQSVYKAIEKGLPDNCVQWS